MSRTKGERVFLGLAMGMVGLVGALGVGCSPPREPLALERARMAYLQAKRDPQVTSQAPEVLQEAEQTLSRAERIWKDDENAEEAQHLAQLTEQRLEIARAVAQQRMAEADIQQLGKERERILQEARAAEFRLVQQEAAQAQQAVRLVQPPGPLPRVRRPAPAVPPAGRPRHHGQPPAQARLRPAMTPQREIR